MPRCLPIFCLFASSCMATQMIGTTPAQSSPEIVQQMRREALAAMTVGETLEFKALHAADAELRTEMQTNFKGVRASLLETNRRYEELYNLVATLPITVDARALTKALESVRAVELKQAE